MTIVTKQVTTDTFDSGTGRLIPAGGLIAIDNGDLELDPKSVDYNTPNLRDPDTSALPAPTVIAAIAPTGPNPTTPQQLMPGAVQHATGYSAPDGSPLLAEGSVAAAEHAASLLEVDEGGAPAVNTGGSTTTDYTAGTVEALTTHLADVDDASELDTLAAVEEAGKNRATALAAIQARRDALAGSDSALLT